MIEGIVDEPKNHKERTDAIYVAGIDIGSSFSKAVILCKKRIIAYRVIPSEGDYARIADRVIGEALDGTDLSVDDISSVTATGYGAPKVSFSHQASNDIICEGRGISHLLPSVRTVVDIGGQFTRVFKMDAEGRVSNFLLSDKCAAGSGKFLQVIAKVLQIDLEDIGELSLNSKKRIDFNAGCAVFAESEAISRVAEGSAVEDILAGLHRALAGKIESMIMRLGIEEQIGLVGGGARDIGLIRGIEERLGFAALVPDEPQIVAALGAALIAAEIRNREVSTDK